MALTIKFHDIALKNPIMAGSCDYSRDSVGFSKIAASGVSAVVLKSVTNVKPLQNPYITKINCLDTAGMPWRKGENFGALYSRGGAMLSIEEWLREIDEIVAASEKHGVVPIGSICASEVQAWEEYSAIMVSKGLRILELNLGNPHFRAVDRLKTAGETSYLDPVKQIIRSVTAAVPVPVMVKVSPQMGRMLDIVQAAEECGASGVTLSHRFQGLIIDVGTGEPLSSSLFGYGGPWMAPITVGHVFSVSESCHIPICASGGIFRVEDFLQALMAGASLVQLTTAMMIEGTGVVAKMLAGLERHLEENRMADVGELIGFAQGKAGLYDRVDGAEVPKVMDTSRCPHCPDKPCLASCFYQAISVNEKGIPEIDDNCIGCELCLQMCPFPGVLSMPGRRYLQP